MLQVSTTAPANPPQAFGTPPAANLPQAFRTAPAANPPHAFGTASAHPPQQVFGPPRPAATPVPPGSNSSMTYEVFSSFPVKSV